MRLVSPRLDVLAGVVVGAALAVVVNRLAVGEERAAVPVERRPALEGQEVDDQRRQVLDVGRAGGEVDQIADAGHGVRDAERAGRIRRRRRDAAERGAGSDRDRGHRSAADLTGDLERRLAADRAVGAVLARRDRPLDDGDVLPGVIVDGLGEVLLGLVPGGRHDRLVVVDRERVEHDLRDGRAARPQERLGVAGAVLKLEPDEHRLLRLRDGARDLDAERLGQRERRGHHAAEAHELPPRDAAALELAPGKIARSSAIPPSVEWGVRRGRKERSPASRVEGSGRDVCFEGSARNRGAAGESEDHGGCAEKGWREPPDPHAASRRCAHPTVPTVVLS